MCVLVSVVYGAVRTRAIEQRAGFILENGFKIVCTEQVLVEMFDYMYMRAFILYARSHCQIAIIPIILGHKFFSSL